MASILSLGEVAWVRAMILESWDQRRVWMRTTALVVDGSDGPKHQSGSSSR
jgi:hypothetical protein